jgi:hypothetical protein
LNPTAPRTIGAGRDRAALGDLYAPSSQVREMLLFNKWGLGLCAALLMSSAAADVQLIDQRRFGDWATARQIDDNGNLKACFASISPISGTVVGTEQLVITTSVHNLIPNLDKGVMRTMFIVNITGVRDTSNDFTGQLPAHLGNEDNGTLLVLLYKTLSASDGVQNLVVILSHRLLEGFRKYQSMAINRPLGGTGDALVFGLNGASQALDNYEACFEQLRETM